MLTIITKWVQLWFEIVRWVIKGDKGGKRGLKKGIWRGCYFKKVCSNSLAGQGLE